MRAQGPATWISPLPGQLLDLLHHPVQVFFFLVERRELFFGQLLAAVEAFGEFAEARAAPAEPGGDEAGENARDQSRARDGQRDVAVSLVAKGGFEPIHLLPDKSLFV